MAPVFWKCPKQGLVSMSTAEAELQILCAGSLATKNVGMLMKEMTKPMKEFVERRETIQELLDKKNFKLMKKNHLKVKKTYYWLTTKQQR